MQPRQLNCPVEGINGLVYCSGYVKHAARLQEAADQGACSVDRSSLKDRHLAAVTRCASGAEASSLLRNGDAAVDIVMVEVRALQLALINCNKITPFWHSAGAG